MEPDSTQKPRSALIRPRLTRLPRLTFARRAFRRLIHLLARILVLLLTRTEIAGLENIPPRGPALIVSNHLGDADVAVGLAYTPRPVDALAKVELYDYPVLGFLMDAYGVIWVHRGRPDRRALRAALDALSQGRLVGIAPEGRESVSGALEQGTGGAAYLALKAQVPIVPLTFVGTENAQVYANLKRLRRSRITVTVGKPFTLEKQKDGRDMVVHATEVIMNRLARQLPAEYRGAYRLNTE